MKKLIVGSFAFVLTLMLCTNVFARNLNITEFNGEEGLLDRAESDSVGSGDVLYIKNYIQQSSSTHNDILSKGIKIIGDGEMSGTSAETTVGGQRVTIDGGRRDGFYMNASAS